MSDRLVVSLNDESMVEYDRNKSLSPRQEESLDRMDSDMDRGIDFLGNHIEDPDPETRARFIAWNLWKAITTDNEPLAAACSAWLATRFPQLKQVKMIEEQDQFLVDLVFDQDFVKPVPIQFVDRKPKDS